MDELWKEKVLNREYHINMLRIAGHRIVTSINNTSIFNTDNIISIDLGGCIGKFTSNFRDYMGGIGKYYIYEPNKLLVAGLNKGAELYDNVFIYDKAVSNKDGEDVFYIGNIKKSSSLKSTHRNLSDESYKVETIALDTVLSEFDKVDIVKIDIEGSELDVLLNTTEENLGKINQLVVEFHLNKGIKNYTQDRINELIRYLFDCGLCMIHIYGNDKVFINKKLLI